jgi:hypothetical protein
LTQIGVTVVGLVATVGCASIAAQLSLLLCGAGSLLTLIELEQQIKQHIRTFNLDSNRCDWRWGLGGPADDVSTAARWLLVPSCALADC